MHFLRQSLTINYSLSGSWYITQTHTQRKKNHFCKGHAVYISVNHIKPRYVLLEVSECGDGVTDMHECMACILAHMHVLGLWSLVESELKRK